MAPYGRATSVRAAAKSAYRNPKLLWPLIRSSVSTRLVGPLWSHRRPGGLVMFHIGRCGSTVLSEMLSQHPEVYWDGETYVRVLQELRDANQDRLTSGFDPASYIERRLPRSGSRWFGFDTKFYHVTDFGLPIQQYLDDLSQIGFSKVIVLRRRNYLRKVVSSRLGYERGWYHTKARPAATQSSVHINVDEIGVDGTSASLIEHFERWDNEYETVERHLGTHQVLHLAFEDDIEVDPLVAYRRVVDFLGLQPHSAQVTLKRVNPQPLAELIQNYDEVDSLLSGTKHHWMLREDNAADAT